MDEGLRKELVEAANASNRTRYRIAKDAGISQTMLDRFLIGERDLTLATADKVIASLGRQFMWVRHLIEMADRSPWFSLDLAWTSIKNSVEVAFNQARKRNTQCDKWADKLKYLEESEAIPAGDVEAIRAMKSEADVALKDEKLTKEKAIDFVARAAIYVDILWGVGA